MGADQFKAESLAQIGTLAWLQFIKAAKALADAEASRGQTYPTPNDACLLCHQTLSPAAIDLIDRIWKFLQSDVQERVSKAEAACDQKAMALETINLNYLGPDSAARRLLEGALPAIMPSIEAQKDALVARRRELANGVRSGNTFPPPLIHVDLSDIQSLIKIKETEIVELEKTDPRERIRDLIAQWQGLRHRQVLKQRLPEIENYVMRLRRAARTRQFVGSTRRITDKHTELFREIVTDRYLDIFGKILRSFKTNLNVTIETRGQKGERVRHITLKPTAFPSGYPAARVLSEGEKTAVAIADFLSESDLDENSRGIILDDPITSLDNEWKNVLAERLAERSKTKQVIIFTHDLAFAYHLTKHAEKCGTAVSTHWVQESGGQPGYVYADNSPVCEQNFKSAEIARQWYAKAKNAPPQEQQHCLQQGFGALRTSYEALIIFELFKNVVLRFEERVSFERLKDVRIEPSDITEIIDRMSALSRHIDAHLHSDKFVPAKPTPQILYNEIEAFEKTKKRIKSRSKSSETNLSVPSSEGQPPSQSGN